MEMPKVVYHGTFWPEDRRAYPRTLMKEDLMDYISTTPDKRWARYFARSKRLFNREESGLLLIYIIDTSKLPAEVRENCIPPGEPDPRPWVREAYGLGDERLKNGWRDERLKIQEWRFLYVPEEAIAHIEETHIDAEPTLKISSMDLRPT